MEYWRDLKRESHLVAQICITSDECQGSITKPLTEDRWNRGILTKGIEITTDNKWRNEREKNHNNAPLGFAKIATV